MCQGIVRLKVADKVSDNADKIKGIKIEEAIKCRILPILIPLVYWEFILPDKVPIYNKV